MHYGIPGIRLAEMLGTGLRYEGPLQIYAPRREGQLDMTDPEDGFVQDDLYSPGYVFNVKQAKYDANYVLTSISFARIDDRSAAQQQGWFTIQGIKLDQKPTQSGVYIHNGRKQVIK
jgi:hypothetical protein